MLANDYYKFCNLLDKLKRFNYNKIISLLKKCNYELYSSAGFCYDVFYHKKNDILVKVSIVEPKCDPELFLQKRYLRKTHELYNWYLKPDKTFFRGRIICQQKCDVENISNSDLVLLKKSIKNFNRYDIHLGNIGKLGKKLVIFDF
jgi:hypothetical protein